MDVMTFTSTYPADGKLFESFDDITDKEFVDKIAAAQSCFEIWRQKSYCERAVIIAKAATILHEMCGEFARIATLEMGKRISEARGEVEFSSRILSYYAKNAEKFLAPVELHPVHGEAHMESSPMGIIFALSRGTFLITNWPASLGHT